MNIRPPVFLLTGLAWLILSSLLGLTLFMGMLLGEPLPASLRPIHVHTALVGGVGQIILGAMLAFIPPLLMTGRDRSESHPGLFLAINGGTIGILGGFWTGSSNLIGGAGLLVVGAFLALLRDGMRQARSSLISPPLNLWFYGVALVMLLIGIGLGELMGFQLVERSWQGRARLSHVHLNLLGFVTLTIIGTMHNLFPTVLNAPLYSPRLARDTFFLLPLGIVVLVVGFILPWTILQITGGILILAGTVLYVWNIVQTWWNAGRPATVIAWHLLLATVFLLVATISGVLVAINSWWDPPLVPFGLLHLIAYTHLALIGFILQTIIGALSHLVPIILAVSRVKTAKKRGPYLEHLTAIAEQWRWLQTGTLTLGTLGLAAVAALVWQLPLRSSVILVTGWISTVLLATAFLVFTSKVVRLVRTSPSS